MKYTENAKEYDSHIKTEEIGIVLIETCHGLEKWFSSFSSLEIFCRDYQF